MLGSEPVLFGLPFAPPEMQEILLEQRETGVVQEPIIAPFEPTVEGRAAMEVHQAQPPPEPTGIPEYVQTGLLDPVGLTDVTKEEMDVWPLTPEGLIDPRSPLYTLITAPGEKITELVKETTYIELGAMPSPGIALPGIGEIKIEMPDILGGLKDVGKYALIAGGLIIAAVLFMRK